MQSLETSQSISAHGKKINDITLRNAAREDFPRLLEIACAFHGESKYSFLPFRARKLEAHFEWLMYSTRFFKVAIFRDEIVGVLGGKIEDYIFCEEYFALDAGFYIVKSSRGSAAAGSLAKSFEKWGFEGGAQEVCFAVTSGVNIERSHRFFTHLGYEHVGGLYKKKGVRHVL